MRNRTGYRFLYTGLRLGLGLLLLGSVAAAQQAPITPTESEVYCSAVATDQAVPADTYIISGENASYAVTFSQGAHVFINHGTDKGAKVGDEFEVVRPIHEMLNYRWFKWQPQLTEAMGTMYADIGRVRVINTQTKTSIAQVEMSCDQMQRGDLVRPFTPRSAPAYHDVQFDPFAPPSGKKMAMIVTTKNYGQLAGTNTIVFVNLGSAEGVHVGDYFRVFRYEGTRNESDYETADTTYKMYGFGSTPVAYGSDSVPRQVLGEGIVLRTGTNSSTVLLTFSREEIYVGDYVEIE